MCRYRSADSIQPCRVVLVVINLLLAELHVRCLKIFMQDFQECKACVKVGLFFWGGFCFVFLSMDTKMSTMSPFGGEAGSGEFSGVLQFEHLFAPEDTANILFALFLISTSYTTTSSHELLFVSSLTQDQFAMGDTPPPTIINTAIIHASILIVV